MTPAVKRYLFELDITYLEITQDMPISYIVRFILNTVTNRRYCYIVSHRYLYLFENWLPFSIVRYRVDTRGARLRDKKVSFENQEEFLAHSIKDLLRKTYGKS